MKYLYHHSGNAFLIYRKMPISKFTLKDDSLNMDGVKAVRDWLGCNHVLRDQTHFLFCETVQDIEFEELNETT